MAKKHSFNFIAGDKLSKIGASFFIVYLYCEKIDKTKDEWKIIKTSKTRIAKMNSNKNYWNDWINEIKKMEPKKLGSNTMKVSGIEVIRRAKSL